MTTNQLLASALVVLALSTVSRAQERVSFAAADGQPLTGTLAKPAGAAKGGVLLVPMYKGTRTAYDALLLRLAKAGYVALSIDLRGHGDSAKTKDGATIEIGLDVAEKPDTNPFRQMWQDVNAGLDHLAEGGAPADKLIVVGADAGAAVALDAAARSADRPKGLVLMTPPKEPLGLTSLEHARTMAQRPVLILSVEDDAADGPRPLKEAMPYEAAELRILPGTHARGTNMFGKIPAIEATIIGWIDGVTSALPVLEITEAKTVIIDGDVSSGEAPRAKTIQIPFDGGKAATVRVSHNRRRLDVAFDVPERYVRLNEVIVYVDGSGKGPRVPDEHCYRVGFSPRNPARKPVLVQRGGLKGFEDSDDKGVLAFGRTEDKSRWSAEISLELSRFGPGDMPKSIRIAFQVNGQRATDVRNHPDDANVATSPQSWAPARIQ
jgi:pimeloyl-ACP methyl ester carboxylesterase